MQRMYFPEWCQQGAVAEADAGAFLHLDSAAGAASSARRRHQAASPARSPLKLLLTLTEKGRVFLGDSPH